MPTRIGYSRDVGLWVLKSAENLMTKKVGGFRLIASKKGEVVLQSSIEPTPEASRDGYGNYNAMMDIPSGVTIETQKDVFEVPWKNDVCPVCNRKPE